MTLNARRDAQWGRGGGWEALDLSRVPWSAPRMSFAKGGRCKKRDRNTLGVLCVDRSPGNLLIIPFRDLACSSFRFLPQCQGYARDENFLPVCCGYGGLPRKKKKMNGEEMMLKEDGIFCSMAVMNLFRGRLGKASKTTSTVDIVSQRTHSRSAGT